MAINGNGAANGGIDKKLQAEIFNLIQYIQRLRSEIAGIAQGKDDPTAFDSMGDRLDAIVESTAQATDTILAAMEAVDGCVEKLRAHPEPAEIDSFCDTISEKSMEAVEACSFQDLTGQRINKIVGSMKFVEERVNAMADLCGREEVQALADEWDLPEQLDDGVALEGPQNAGEGISQADIDDLFA
jgi:chemotaxis protein CheZ